MKSPLSIRILAALVAGGAAIGVSFMADEYWGLVALVVAMILVTMGVAFLTRGEKRLPYICDPMVLVIAFCCQFFVIGPLALPLFDYHIFYQLPLELVARALFGFLLLFVCFFVAYQSPAAAAIGFNLPDFRGGRMKLPGRWAEWTVIGASAIGIGTFFYYQGGIVEYLSLGYGQAKFSGLYQLPFHALILGTVLMAWRLADAPRPSKADITVFALLLITEIIFYGVVLSVRNRVIFLFFSLYTVWIMRRGFTRMIKWSVVPVLIALLVFFSWWGSMRHHSMQDLWSGKNDVNKQYEMSAARTYFFAVAEPFAVACIVMDIFPTVEPYRHGRTLLVTLLGFIPRAVWPDKPIGFGKEVTKYTDGIFYNARYGHSLTVTFLGDFYVNGGWFGIVLGGTIFGFLCRIVATYTAKNMRNGIQVNAARVLLAAIFASSLAEVRADASVFLAYHGMMTMWLLPTFLFFRLNYSEDAAAARGGSVPDAIAA